MKELVDTARSVRGRAYCPYSGYAVGAAVLDESGRIWPGCNVENVSYGVTLCAERAALAAMVAGGGKKVRAVAVATQDGGTPCGMCRQALAEFAAAAPVAVYCVAEDGSVRELVLSDLLPDAFRSEFPGARTQ